MRVSNLLLTAYLVAASALASIATPADAAHAKTTRSTEEILVYSTPEGSVYLFPTSSFHCGALKDAFAETAPDESGDTVVEHGCWRTDGADVVIITDDKLGAVIDLAKFKATRVS